MTHSEMNNAVTYKKLSREDCHPGMLAKLNRYQESRRWWCEIDGVLTLKDDNLHIDDWNDQQKIAIAKRFRRRIKDGGAVFGAYLDGDLIGEASIKHKLFGREHEYIQLSSLHVSLEHRSRGIGRELFRLACAEAKRFGAKKLYISSQPSEETQAFYKAVGCVPAAEINRKLFRKMPSDRHLEYIL